MKKLYLIIPVLFLSSYAPMQASSAPEKVEMKKAAETTQTAIEEVLDSISHDDAYEITDVNIIKMAIKDGLSLSSKTKIGQNTIGDALLLKACAVNAENEEEKQKQVDIVTFLIEQGANIDATTEGDTTLHEAVRSGNTAIVQILIDKKRKEGDKALATYVNAKTDYYTALLIAAIDGNRDIVEILLNARADTEAVDENEGTALHCAAQLKHIEIVKTLIAHNVNINAQNIEKDTALMIATRYGNTDVVQMLLDAGANTEIKNKYGNTALDDAIRCDQPGALRLIVGIPNVASQIERLKKIVKKIDTKTHPHIKKILDNVILQSAQKAFIAIRLNQKKDVAELIQKMKDIHVYDAFNSKFKASECRWNTLLHTALIKHNELKTKQLDLKIINEIIDLLVTDNCMLLYVSNSENFVPLTVLADKLPEKDKELRKKIFEYIDQDSALLVVAYAAPTLQEIEKHYADKRMIAQYQIQDLSQDEIYAAIIAANDAEREQKERDEAAHEIRSSRSTETKSTATPQKKKKKKRTANKKNTNGQQKPFYASSTNTIFTSSLSSNNYSTSASSSSSQPSSSSRSTTTDNTQGNKSLTDEMEEKYACEGGYKLPGYDITFSGHGFQQTRSKETMDRIKQKNPDWRDKHGNPMVNGRNIPIEKIKALFDANPDGVIDNASKSLIFTHNNLVVVTNYDKKIIVTTFYLDKKK